jgi:hypothetical protein
MKINNLVKKDFKIYWVIKILKIYNMFNHKIKTILIKKQPKSM